ncbi:coiled-coil domain-containing protein 18 isoform X1 [Tiliqua scincoides]|uniref:coiled-coil domain-containing protein 18 isoform X1 n=1 Tax=Tiliqua scincoides TaxID=71010 RepID=UPI003462467F
MESNIWAFHDHHADEENLLANVVALRSQLRKTEQSLQNVGEELFSTCALDDLDDNIHDNEREILTMEDLVDSSELQNSSAYSTAGRLSWKNRDSTRKPRNNSFSLSLDKCMEEENELLRDKLNMVREQNASLTSQNHHLMNEVETINFELKQSKARISFLECALGARSVSIPVLEDQIESLEAEVEAQDNVLRDAEDKLEQSQKSVMEKEYVLQKFKEEYKKMKLDLIEQSKQGKRTEQQRNEALHNAEELTRTFKKYKMKITEKLEKVQKEGQILETNLTNCVKEKEKLRAQCDSYRCELEDMKEQLRQLLEENSTGKGNLKRMEARSSEMELQLKHSQQKIQTLETKLWDQDTVIEEKNGLVKQNADLKALIAKQNNHLKLYNQEIENSRFELNALENIISQLSHSSSEVFNHPEKSCASYCQSSGSVIGELSLKLKIKEAKIQKLQAELMANKMAPDLSDGCESQESNGLHCLETEPVKLTGNQTERKWQQLEFISKQFEKEKQRLIRQLEDLRSKLQKSEDENSSLKENMTQRTIQFQAIQKELLEKAAKSSTLEREIARKSSQLSVLEKHLEEKTVGYTTAAARNAQLEQELLELNSKLHNLERNLSEKHDNFTVVLEKAQLIHLEQHKEMETQIELLQSQLETKNQQFMEQEKTMSILQQDIFYKQHQIESLDRLLIESKEETEKQNTKKEEALKVLQNELNQETIKVKQLQTALDIYKKDLTLYLNQLEESKMLFEKQLKKKTEEVQRLQKEIKLKNDNLQSTNEQNLRLQQALQQQQQMLHEEAIRNGELEDSQTQLQKQLLKLEQESQKQKESLEEELKKANEKLHLATEETESKRQKVTELTSTVRQIKIEMDQCKDDILDMEKELVHLRREVHTKATQVAHLEMALEQKLSELHKKTQQVKELEDNLLQSEMQQKDTMQRTEMLENELQNVTGELKATLRQLQELRDVLQNAQMSLEEKYAAIQDLTEELRESKDELEDKKQELLDMDQALKERNWELKQRAAQVTQLDMTIREHKGEMEQKIIELEGSLERAELQIREYNKQIESLESKLQHSKDELHEKEFGVLQQDQEINNLKKEIERKQQTITDTEKNTKNQEKRIADQRKEILDLGQQLRLEREQMKRIHVELLESRRQLAQCQREVERRSHELEEVNHISHEKEGRVNHLAEQLGAAQARETQLEASMQAEINRLSAEIESLKESYSSEKLALEAQQTKWQQSANKQASQSYLLNGQLKQLTLELEDAQRTVCDLQQQLQSRNEIIQAANEALLLKESEVTRLQTRIACHERIEGIRQLALSPSLPSHQWLDDQELEFAKRSHFSYSTHRKLRRSTSSNDLSVKHCEDSLDLKQTLTLDSSVTCKKHKDISNASPKSLNESSFDPLTHMVHGDGDTTCDSTDFHTLSGMLKYINQEMKKSENSSL